MFEYGKEKGKKEEKKQPKPLGPAQLSPSLPFFCMGHARPTPSLSRPGPAFPFPLLSPRGPHQSPVPSALSVASHLSATLPLFSLSDLAAPRVSALLLPLLFLPRRATPPQDLRRPSSPGPARQCDPAALQKGLPRPLEP
jgi:hypothetical protein